MKMVKFMIRDITTRFLQLEDITFDEFITFLNHYKIFKLSNIVNLYKDIEYYVVEYPDDGIEYEDVYKRTLEDFRIIDDMYYIYIINNRAVKFKDYYNYVHSLFNITIDSGGYMTVDDSWYTLVRYKPSSDNVKYMYATGEKNGNTPEYNRVYKNSKWVHLTKISEFKDKFGIE